MFSTNQETVVKALVESNLKTGYKYYLAFTHTTINSGYQAQVQPDLYIYFSKNPITANSGYQYFIPEDSVLYTIRTPNYSTNTTAVNTERIVTSNVSNQNVSVSVYEHIYTNSLFESYDLQPEIYTEGVQTNANLQTIAIFTAVLVFFLCFWKMWKIHK